MQPQETFSQVCKGKTKLGKSCARTANLNEEGYCYQHADQGSGKHEASAEARDSSLASPASAPSPAPAAPPSPTSPPSASVSIQDEPEEEQTSQEKHLERCQAISKSTNRQCKHHVSFSGEKFCPTHNGKQKVPKSPQHEQCQAIANRTRRQCEKHVKKAGDKFCTIHARKDEAAPSPQAQPQVQQQQQQPPTAPGSPASSAEASLLFLGPFQAALTQHLLSNHQSHGHCTPGTRCRTFRLIQACQEFVKKQAPPDHINMMAHWVSMLQHMDPAQPQAARGGASPTQPMPPSPVEPFPGGSFPFDLEDPSFLQSLMAATPMPAPRGY